MKVLVVDNNPVTRVATKRILVRDLDALVTEADNGIDALDLLATHKHAFVVLDLELPILSGLRMLEILRDAPDDAAVPVIVMASRTDEATVRKVIELNVSEFILKPIQPQVLARRLAQFAHRCGLDSNRVEVRDPVFSTLAPLTTRVLIADGDGDFRHFVASTLHGKVGVMQAATGTQALKLCISTPPHVALIGHNLGLLKSNFLVRELRSVRSLQATRIVAVAPKNLVESVLSTADYDAVLARTFIPELFLDQFNGLFRPPGSVARMLAVHPPLRVNLISAIEQVCGMMLGLEVAVLARPPARWAGPGLTATVEITAVVERLTLTFGFSCGLEAARAMTSRLSDQPVGQLGDDECRATIGELANIVTGRLKHSFSERGVAVRCGLPVTQMHDLQADPIPVSEEDGLDLFFGSADQTLELKVTLREPPPATV